MRALLWIALAAVLLWLLLRSAGRATAATGLSHGAPPDAPVQASPAQPAGIVPGNSFGDAIDNITQAWAQSEGNQPSNRNWRNNNPGNLKYSSWEGAAGQDSGGFAIFSDVGDGWDALTRYLTRLVQKNPGWDLYDVSDYALRGSTTAASVDEQGDSDAKADYMGSYAGIDPTQPLGSVLGIGS